MATKQYVSSTKVFGWDNPEHRAKVASTKFEKGELKRLMEITELSETTIRRWHKMGLNSIEIIEKAFEREQRMFWS